MGGLSSYRGNIHFVELRGKVSHTIGAVGNRSLALARKADHRCCATHCLYIAGYRYTAHIPPT